MKMTELYTAADLARMEKRNRAWAAVAVAVCCAGLAACVVLCCLTTTATARQMEYTVILASIGIGWVDITLWLSAAAGKRELRHARMLCGEEAEVYTGRVTVTGRRLRIPAAGVFYHVELEDASGVRRLRVIEQRRRQLQKAGEHLALRTVRGYVAAYEVTPCE